MAKPIKTFLFGFLSLLLLINLLMITLIFMPSDKSLSFAMQDSHLFVQSSDLPNHVRQAFSFLKIEGQNIRFSIPSSDNFSKRWMAKLLEARQQHWSQPHDHFTFYLNTLDFGDNVIGIEQAADYYFDKSSINLTATEAESLARLYHSLYES